MRSLSVNPDDVASVINHELANTRKSEQDVAEFQTKSSPYAQFDIYLRECKTGR
jgi:hypothetical protein